MVPEHETIAFAGGNYFSIAHQFVFYSDRTLVQEPGGAAGVRAALDRGGWALVARDHAASVAAGEGRHYPAVVSAGDWMLVHAAPVPPVVLGRTGPAVSPE
jgi:hypothetical protein